MEVQVSKDRLIIVEDVHGNYQLQWWLADEDDTGAVIGDECSGDQRPLLLIWARNLEQGKVPEEDIEHYAATVGAASHKRTEMYTGGGSDFGFYWTSKKDAQQALRLAQLRIKEVNANTPWPQWARDAVVNGWKPPKGWKPA